MNENNEIIIEEPSKNEKNSVGKILRDKRVEKNISIEKLSKDLRIGKTYIEAIENDNFNTIPAAIYVRAYVKNIAEYLKLDTNDLLRQLSGEKGKPSKHQNKEKSIAEESTLNVSPSEENKNKGYGILILLVILLVTLIYFAVIQNNKTQNEIVWIEVDTNEIILEEKEPDSEEFAVPEFEGEIIDTATIDTTDTTAADTTEKAEQIIEAETETAVTAAPEKIEMTLKVIKDSSWIEIFADGEISHKGKTIHAPSEIITAAANDSINIRSGALGTVEIFVNGTKIDETGTTGIWTFTKDGARNVSRSQWERIRTAVEKRTAQ